MTEPSTQVLSEPSNARFELRCWGEFRLLDRLNPAGRLPPRRKARALIAYLAAQGGTSINRERLAALLWSERGNRQARASLRQTLLELRPFATAPKRLLVIERDQVHLDRAALTSDIAHIEALARADNFDALRQALAEKGDRLYSGLDGLDPAFDEWLALERRVQQDHLLALGAATAARGLNHGAYEAVSRLAIELQRLDETNEAFAQIGMQADHARRDPSAVGRRYRRLCVALKDDLGITPSRETEILLRDLTGPERRSSAKSEPPPAMQPVTSPADDARPTVAVLPFINRSGRPADGVFADAMAEDLAAALSGRSELNVVAASATAINRETETDLRQIGRDLGVHYLLNGNVRRMGDDLRVTAELLETDSGNILWSQKLSRPLEKVSTLQEDLVTDVAENLGARVLRFEMEQALKRAGLGKLHDALQLAERAVALKPNFATAHLGLGSILVRLGRLDEALAEFDTVERLARNSVWTYFSLTWRSVAHLEAGRHQEALGAADQAVRLMPAPEALVQSMLCLAKLNQWERARDALRRLLDADPGLSSAQIQSLVHESYIGSNALDNYTAIAREICDDVLKESR